MQKSLETVRYYYPEGVLFYYQPEPRLARKAEKVLTDALPHHLVVVTPLVHDKGYYPNDLGQQIGPTLYSNGMAFAYAATLLKSKGFTLGEICANLPYPQEPHLEGGYLVTAGTGKSFFYSENGLSAAAAARVSSDTRRTFDPVPHAPDLYRMLCNSPSVPKTDKWLYRTGDGHHIDLTVTGFDSASNPERDPTLFADRHVAEGLELFGVSLPGLHSYPHDLSLRGGLNMHYINNGSDWIALAPSERTIEPMQEELRRSGFQPCFLGEGQTSNGAGIKCRTLLLNWQDC